MQYIYDEHVFDKWQNLEEVQICQSAIAKLKLQCIVLSSRIVVSMNLKLIWGVDQTSSSPR
jgi:hypothetical protein